MLGSFVGPLFGILIADFYLVRKQQVVIDDLYSMSKEGRYWYKNGYNPKAIWPLIPAALVPTLCVFIPAWQAAANYAWFIGMGLGFVRYLVATRKA